MINIHVLSAGDRNNYGDLLFPIIIKKYLESKNITISINNYGVIASDLSYFGALPTFSSNDLIANYKKDENNKIIIAGGEVIGGGWLNILRFVSGFWNKMHHNKYFRYLINRIGLLENYMLYKIGQSRPFIIDGSVFSKDQIYYNSIGAQGSKKLLTNSNVYQTYFRNIKHLSVRDKNSAKIFKDFNIEYSLVPDSALIMSDLITYGLEEFVTDSCKELASKNYVFFQIGDKKGPENIVDFMNKIQTFTNKFSLEIILCPIGLALDHGDDIVLQDIKSKFPNMHYYQPKNLYETMYLLKNTKMYIGTSLHGVVTAQSFNVPFFIFPEKIGKLKIYVDTWFDNPEDKQGHFCDTSKIEKSFLSYDAEKEKNNTQRQKDLIYKNLNTIFFT